MRSINGYHMHQRTDRFDAPVKQSHDTGAAGIVELELELIQTRMAQKPMLRANVYARALRASQNVKRAEVWLGARCAWCVRGAWASAGVPTHI
jgi:hypothetical protein